MRVDPDEDPRAVALDPAEDDRGGLLRAVRNAIFANWSASSSGVLSADRVARAIPVLTPPGCTQLTATGSPAISSSWRSASVNPRTANFAAQ